ncbi:MAG: hypothetical protein ACOX18_02520 [Bacillota bacterium]|jgi:hypothetical protein
MKTIVVTLRPVESKRLLGKAVVALPEVQHAYRHGRLIVAGGTTNAYVLEELTGEFVDKGSYTAGVIAEGYAGVTDPAVRQEAAVFVHGELVRRPWTEVIAEFEADDVMIKGANAIDLEGNAGILLGGRQGGTIGIAMGYLAASGAQLIMPVGLEKLVPSVRDAAAVLGRSRVSDDWSLPCGMFVVSAAEIITEVEAIEWLYDVEAIPVAGGGVAGSEGSITLAVSGEADDIEQFSELVSQLKQEPLFTVRRQQ